ncbi:N-acetylmuramoyl-L-alanine amidase [Sporosarcina sp. FSL K6-1522]|uniref:N-acetylmuramoyl-L-alanine amidase family protein n=1 Tax=Sporosarcina sp. FSL K6-1522 TaxID=2921554 RepID=UPI003159E6FD
MAKIFIDPGHGGHDPGAVGRHSKEKDNALKVGLRLKTLLESYGHTVKMSRSTDVFLTLSERARLANAWGADYFVSLHNNAASASATGFETFAHNGALQSKTLVFQSAIHNAIAKELGIRDRGEKRANYAVLRETRMPAVLIEYAFISNVNDERILINEVEKLAQLTANGIVSYAGGVKPTKPAPPTVAVDTPKEDDEMAEQLPDTQKEDMKNLLEHAYNTKGKDGKPIFSVNHAPKVDTMTRGQATDLLISYVARTNK